MVGSTWNDTSINATITYYSSYLGVNFLAFYIHLIAPNSYFAVGAVNTVYFQIEQPVPVEAASSESTNKRLLSEKKSKTEAAPVPTGTGTYQGLIASYKIVKANDVTLTYIQVNNTWGNKKINSTDNQFYTKLNVA